MLVKGKSWMNFGASVALIGALHLAGCGDDTKETASDSNATTSTSTPTTGVTDATSGTTAENPTTSVGTTGSMSGSTSENPTTSDTTGGGLAMCMPILQDCPDGQKCTSYEDGTGMSPGWNNAGCVPDPVNGGAVGDPCQINMGEGVFSGLDNCAKGNICLNFDFDTGLGGTCTEYCNENKKCPNTANGDAVCVEGANEGVLPICLPACDPLLQDCQDMQGCYGDTSLDGFICFSPDTGMGTGQAGEPCEFTNACAAGFSCQDGATVEGCQSAYCCSAFCPVDADNCTNPSEDCVPFYPVGTAPPGLENVGVCGIPQ